MDNITIAQIIKYLTSVCSISYSDSEKEQNIKANEFVTSIMLYNYYSRRSGISNDTIDTDTYFGKLYNFIKNNQK